MVNPVAVAVPLPLEVLPHAPLIWVNAPQLPLYTAAAVVALALEIKMA